MIITQKKPLEEVLALVGEAKTVAVSAPPPVRPAARRKSKR